MALLPKPPGPHVLIGEPCIACKTTGRIERTRSFGDPRTVTSYSALATCSVLETCFHCNGSGLCKTRVVSLVELWVLLDEAMATRKPAP